MSAVPLPKLAMPRFEISLDDGNQLNTGADTQAGDITAALLATMRTAATVAIAEIGDRSERRSFDVRVEDPQTGEGATATVVIATTVRSTSTRP